MSRPSRDEVYMEMARTIAKRSTCARRDVGCILVREDGHVLATGYNGKPRGFKHCKGGASQCSGAGAPSGASLDACEAVHAEQNALLQCADVDQIYVAYCTTQPCVHCVKLLLNTGCQTIVYDEPYSHVLAEALWEQAGRVMVRVAG